MRPRVTIATKTAGGGFFVPIDHNSHTMAGRVGSGMPVSGAPLAA